MPRSRWFSVLPFIVALVTPSVARSAPPVTSCPQVAVLSRLLRHRVAPGDTLTSIAQQYNLIPATLMGMNPALQQRGRVTVGTDILVPPYNGIRVQIPAGQTWRDVAIAYGIRADVLYEVNGCQATPKVVFVPGVNWSPIAPVAQRRDRDRTGQRAIGNPLPTKATVAVGYGWGIIPTTGEVGFHSGLDLEAEVGTSVLAAEQGVVAFAGTQGAYGNLVVLNHAGGRQTRYAHLESIRVKTGQTLRVGAVLGTVGTTGTPSYNKPHLHFELRYNSNLGWVATDPSPL